jgi:hypothetical protein
VHILASVAQAKSCATATLTARTHAALLRNVCGRGQVRRPCRMPGRLLRPTRALDPSWILFVFDLNARTPSAERPPSSGASHSRAVRRPRAPIRARRHALASWRSPPPGRGGCAPRPRSASLAHRGTFVSMPMSSKSMSENTTRSAPAAVRRRCYIATWCYTRGSFRSTLICNIAAMQWGQTVTKNDLKTRPARRL